MTVLGRTKTLPQLLEDTRDLLAEAWPAAPTTTSTTLGDV
jgi:ATP adenylyltransferase